MEMLTLKGVPSQAAMVAQMSGGEEVCRLTKDGVLVVHRVGETPLQVQPDELARWRAGDFSQTTLPMSQLLQVVQCFAQVLDLLKAQTW
jgi:hypothetical protein